MTPEERYEMMKSFVITFSEMFWQFEGLSPESSLRSQIEKGETRSKRFARIGVEQAFNDCMEASQDFGEAKIEKLNERLKELRLPTFGDMQRMFLKRYASVLKRGRIRTQTEFYLLRNVVDAPQTLPEDRTRIFEMLDEYEFRKKQI